MSRQADRRPMVYSRVDPDELKAFQDAADEHYDGNLSLVIRLALRDFVARLRKQQNDEKGRAA